MSDTTRITINLDIPNKTGDRTTCEILGCIADLSQEQREFILRFIRHYRMEIGKSSSGMVN